jgi:hypothetical protein
LLRIELTARIESRLGEPIRRAAKAGPREIIRERKNEMKTNAVTARKSAVLLFGVIGAGFVALDTAGAQQGELPAGPDRELVAHECAACHDLEMVIAAAGASRQAWTDTVDEMVRYGARIDPQDRPRIVEYLSSVLGPTAKKPTAR